MCAEDFTPIQADRNEDDDVVLAEAAAPPSKLASYEAALVVPANPFVEFRHRCWLRTLGIWNWDNGVRRDDPLKPAYRFEILLTMLGLLCAGSSRAQQPPRPRLPPLRGTFDSIKLDNCRTTQGSGVLGWFGRSERDLGTED
jgi:hypothetical protein